jgi:NCAIR mutase (PurE)-related protein
MEKERLTAMLKQVSSGKLSVPDAMKKLRNFPMQDMGFAQLDTQRSLRHGFPEVVFCQGKRVPDTLKILKALAAENSNVLATRAGPELLEQAAGLGSDWRCNSRARTISLERERRPRTGKLLILTAGTSDIPVAEEALVTADIIGADVEHSFDVGVAGIHRLLHQREKIQAADVVIVVAGMEGALASVVGGMVDRPIIAVPTSIGYGASFEGLAALLAMLNSCAAGVTVVNIDNGFGAGFAAANILRLKNTQQEPQAK